MELNLLEQMVLEAMDSESDKSFSSDSLESSDDEVLNIVPFFVGKDKRNCIGQFLEEVVPSYTEKEFITHFRINRTLYKRLVDTFTASEEYNKPETQKTFSEEMHIALFLWFAGHEACSYRDIADRFNLALGTVCFIINRVIYFISNLCDSVIRWPTEEEKTATSLCMRNKTGIQGVIGIIDGTRIKTDPPKHGKNDYIDRKNITSLGLQAICNEKRKFIDIFVGYPGSVHDNRIYENSDVYSQLPNLCGSFFLLGDSAYACSQYLITPYRDNGHLSSRQTFFNRKLSSGRIVIEHSFELLKQRFRQLYYCKLKGIKKLCHFIRACIVLHNLCNDDELPLEIGDENIEENVENNNAVDQEQGFNL